MRLCLSNQYVLILASDDRRRHGYRCSILEAGGRMLAAAAAGALTTECVEVKHADERVPELFAHRAVENEVDSVVDERQDVEQIAECHVDFVDKARQQAAQQVDDALWQLRHEEQYDHQQQHQRRTVCLTIAAAGTLFACLGHCRALPTQILTTFLCLSHSLNKQKAEDRQPNARNQPNEQCLDRTNRPLLT